MRMRLAAHECVHARRQRDFHLQCVGAIWRIVADPRGCVLSSVQPCPSLRWVPASELGSEGLPERQERRRKPRCARPCQPTHACLVSKSPCAHPVTLTHVCARSVHAMPRPSMPPAPPSYSVSLPPSPLLPRRFLSPGRCRSEWHAGASPAAVLRPPALTWAGGFVRMLGGLLLGVAVGIRGMREDRSGAAHCASGHAFVLRSARRPLRMTCVVCETAERCRVLMSGHMNR